MHRASRLLLVALLASALSCLPQPSEPLADLAVAGAGFESEKCTAEVGKRADLAIAGRDLTAIPSYDLEQFHEARILAAVVGGEVAYRTEN